MKLPIYSHIKAKLESKGLDSSTSGQIAWFVCSIGIFIPPMLYLYQDQYTFLFVIFFIFVFNLFYIVNIFPLLLVIVFVWIYIDYSYIFKDIVYILVIAFIALALICLILKKWHFLITFCFGMTFIFLSLKIFQILGGFYK